MSDKPQDRWREWASDVSSQFEILNSVTVAKWLLEAADRLDNLETIYEASAAYTKLIETERDRLKSKVAALSSNCQSYRDVFERLAKENFTCWQVQNLAKVALGVEGE